MNKRLTPFSRGLAAAIALGGFSAGTNAQGIASKVVLAFRQQNSGALTYSVMSFDNVRFTQSVPSRLTAISVTGTTATIAYWGTPGDSYVIQRSTNLVAWVAIRTNTVPGSGAVTNSDTFSDLGPPPYPRSAYYRLQTH